MANYKRRFVRGAGRGGDRESELNEEIRAHLSMRVDELVAAGLPRDEAEAEAKRRFGNLESAKQRLNRTDRWRDRRLGWIHVVESVFSDLKLALREARRSKGFVLLELTTLAVGVGLATLAFTLVDRVLLRPLPFPEPESLVALYSVPEAGMDEAFPFVSSENWMDWEEGNRTLESTALYFYELSRGATMVDGVAEPHRMASVSAQFFDVLRPTFLLGRGFSEEEVASGAPVIVVSEGFWRSVLGAPESLDGVSTTLDDRTRRVVGVVQADHIYPEEAEIWVPRDIFRRGDAMRNNISFFAIARLRAEASIDQARADLSRIAEGVREAAPGAIYSYGVDVRPMAGLVVAGATRSQLILIMGGVLVLLLASAVNLSGLNLARAADRIDETALRLAMGSGRARLVRSRLTRQLLVTFAGAALGIGLAVVGLQVIRSYAVDLIPRSSELAIDLRIAGFGVLTSICCGLVASVYPALRASSINLRSAITPGSGEIGSVRRFSGRAMVGSQVALAVLLLVGSTLLLRSFWQLTSRDLGFDPGGVIATEVALTPSEYQDLDNRMVFWRRLESEIEALPGVIGASIVNAPPTSDGGTGFTEIEGDEERQTGAAYRVTGPDYFEVMEIPLLAGRSFGPNDIPDEPTTVINETMAESHWPGQNPVGKRVRAASMERFESSPAPLRTVIGIVGDIRHGGYEAQPRAEMYVRTESGSIYQTRVMWVVARTVSTGDRLVEEEILSVLRGLDPRLVPEVSWLGDRLSNAVASRRLLAAVISMFGLMAVFVAALGVYGLLSFTVRRRTKEMGIRGALGAVHGTIVGMIVRDAMIVSTVGMGVGLVTAWAIRRILASQVVDVSTSDPMAFLVAGVIPVMLALLAALIPAMRASRIDPVVALRER